MTVGSTSTLSPVIQSLEDTALVYFFGGETRLRATSAMTNGQLAIIEQVGPPGLGSPYHIHHNEDEQFYIIEGQLRFVSEGKSWIVGPGAFVFLPRDVPHGFEVVGDTPARFLLMVTPGGFDQFVAELSEDAPAPPDMPKVMEAAGRYGLEILGPLPE